MKIKYYLISLIVSLFFLNSCLFDNCIKIPLRTDEMEWFDAFKPGQVILYISDRDNIDEFQCGEILNNYSKCNKIEKGDFQYNEVSVEMKMVKNPERRIAMFFSKDIQDDTISNCYKRFRVYDMKIEGEIDLSATMVDTLINGKTYQINYFESKNDSYVQEFLWSKESGLLQYKTSTGEIFRVKE